MKLRCLQVNYLKSWAFAQLAAVRTRILGASVCADSNMQFMRGDFSVSSYWSTIFQGSSKPRPRIRISFAGIISRTSSLKFKSCYLKFRQRSKYGIPYLTSKNQLWSRQWVSEMDTPFDNFLLLFVSFVPVKIHKISFESFFWDKLNI